MNESYKKQWEEFRDQELIKVTLLLEQLGFSLEDKQVHISGERYLTGSKKLVLVGRKNSDNQKVIIKVSSDPDVIREIEDERKSRNILKSINFAYHIFNSPKEILYTKRQDHLIFVTEFIDQETTFLERVLVEQFFIALKAFEAQEAIHATTYEHSNVIRDTFGIWDANTYLKNLVSYLDCIEGQPEVLNKAKEFIENNLETIDVYCNFLTHWDLVPHNFRVRGHDMYLLDHSSLRFGNKYEGWARFINFMTLHNPSLEKLLLNYIKDNRDQSEYLSLKLMRVFRLVELIWYYSSTLENTAGNHRILNTKRIELWSTVLSNVLDDKSTDDNIIEEYKRQRDSLRSPEEKQRQDKLH